MSEEASKLILSDEDMKTLLDYNVSEEDTQVYRRNYDNQLVKGRVTLETTFQYAWCLTHSKRKSDLQTASALFEEIFKEGSEEIKRDSLFYLSIAETKQKNYVNAKKYINAFLEVEPNNVQAQQLKSYIEKHLQSDGVSGLALVGGAALFGGAAALLFGTIALTALLGFSLKKKK